MANVLKDTMNNIPPKARLVLGLSALMAVGIIFVFIKSYGGNKDIVDNLPTGAEVVRAPRSNQIDKTVAGEEIILPEGSPILDVVEKEKKKQTQNAKDNYDNAFDRIILENKKEVEVKKEIENLPKPVPSALKDTGVYDEQIAREKEKLKNRNVSTNTTSRNTQSNAVLFNEEAFMRDELTLSNNLGSAYSDLNRLRPAGPGQTGTSSTSKSSSSTSKTTSESRTANKVQGYVRSSDKMPTIDSEQISRNRGESVVSGANTVTSYNSVTSSKKSNAENFKNSQSNYASMVDPLNRTVAKTYEKVNLGEMHYAILQIGVNTDEIGPVRAYIPGYGKLGDSILLGEPVRVGSKVSIVFKNLTKDGVDYPVTAVALDAETLRPGLADSVDNHTLQRYLKLAIAAAADGYVSALTGYTSTTTSDGTTETIVESLPDADDQLALALGTIGQKLLPSFENDFNMPPTVEVYGNKDIVIMFMNSFEIK